MTSSVTVLSPNKLQTRVPPHQIAFYLTHNEHKHNLAFDFVGNEKIPLRTLREQREGDPNFSIDRFPDPTDMEQAFESDELWEMQWFPDTPVGSFYKCASTLEKLNESIDSLVEYVGKSEEINIVLPPNTVSFELSHNDHKTAYLCAEQEIRSLLQKFPEKAAQWVSDEERQKTMSTEEWWMIKWRDSVNEDLHRMSASTLDALNEYFLGKYK